MGQDVSGNEWSNEQRQRYREKVLQNLDVFERMLVSSSFEADEGMTGLEIELNLVDSDLNPSFDNAAVLDAIDSSAFQTELAKFNIELNVDPRVIEGDALYRLEDDIRAGLNAARERAQRAGSDIVQIGILPTLMTHHVAPDSGWMSANRRYLALNDAMMAARGEDMYIDIAGSTGERLAFYSGSIGPEAACTSLQLHVQVAPSNFAAYWNAAQALSGVLIAISANSPFLCGKALWHETRIPLFTQATDTRPIELANQGVRPRVGFGERWITSIFDLFEDNVRYFPALLPELTDEDPVSVLAEGVPPELGELRLHNGTIYRWNRPIYDTHGGKPHLRVENRILPAGPTVADTIASAAFYYGALRKFATVDRPVWTQMSFQAAETNFRHGARDGMFARLYWPSFNAVSPDELVLRHLLPLAHEGLADLGVPTHVRDHYLGIIEARCLARQNGATWQLEAVRRHEDAGADRLGALRAMFADYIERMHSNEPVHTWALPGD
ncbi:glutamate-cysteine ligase family protein [Agilicoccus flavus]|uniref:glutamate-cysteine ligase family protein n=1 Tax=Agilicoccus flavus TaxID=2775968 RepID=UPI001CF68878|nr:glutamate-cysteine ligase family protein [Agilicoccus flavus]